MRAYVEQSEQLLFVWRTEGCFTGDDGEHADRVKGVRVHFVTQRPHLFRTVFAHDAVSQSQFTFHTDVADEDEHHGVVAIAEVFKRLGAACENTARHSPRQWRTPASTSTM